MAIDYNGSTFCGTSNEIVGSNGTSYCDVVHLCNNGTTAGWYFARPLTVDAYANVPWCLTVTNLAYCETCVAVYYCWHTCGCNGYICFHRFPTADTSSPAYGRCLIYNGLLKLYPTGSATVSICYHNCSDVYSKTINLIDGIPSNTFPVHVSNSCINTSSIKYLQLCSICMSYGPYVAYIDTGCDCTAWVFACAGCPYVRYPSNIARYGTNGFVLQTYSCQNISCSSSVTTCMSTTIGW